MANFIKVADIVKYDIILMDIQAETSFVASLVLRIEPSGSCSSVYTSTLAKVDG